MLLKNIFKDLLKKIVWQASNNFNLLLQSKKRECILLKKNKNIKKHTQEKPCKSCDKNINLIGEHMIIQNDGIQKINNYNCSVEEFLEEMRKFILKTEVVLDIGCGIRPQIFFVPKVHVCVEPFEQYRAVIKPFFPNDCQFIFLKNDALESIRILDDNSVDTVFMIDLIEHLEKEDGNKLLKEANRVSRRQIIVFTPFGFYPMSHSKIGQKDAWGLNGVDLQEHRSGWLPEDFGEDWNFYICKNCHEPFLEEEKTQGKKYDALMAIKTKVFDGFPIINEVPEFVKEIYNNKINNESN